MEVQRGQVPGGHREHPRAAPPSCGASSGQGFRLTPWKGQGRGRTHTPRVGEGSSEQCRDMPADQAGCSPPDLRPAAGTLLIHMVRTMRPPTCFLPENWGSQACLPPGCREDEGLARPEPQCGPGQDCARLCQEACVDPAYGSETVRLFPIYRLKKVRV